uniref:Uncharacterized protein n=1 Tax=Arundo donax TaxID=35708 RepID=A0A0A9HBK0_ARUDO
MAAPQRGVLVTENWSAVLHSVNYYITVCYSEKTLIYCFIRHIRMV